MAAFDFVSGTSDEPNVVATLASEVVTSEVTAESVGSLVLLMKGIIEEARVTAAVAVDSLVSPSEEVETPWLAEGDAASVPSSRAFPVEALTDTFVVRSVTNTAELDERVWLTFKGDKAVTEVEAPGPKSVVTDLLVRGLMTSFTYVANPSGMVLWTFDDVTCLVVLWDFTVFDMCSVMTVMAGVLMEKMVLVIPSGLCVDEYHMVEMGVESEKEQEKQLSDTHSQ